MARHPRLELLAFAARRKPLHPGGPNRTATRTRGSPRFGDIVRHCKFRRGQAKLLARRLDLGLAERRAMRRRRALLVGRAIADDRLTANKRWPLVGHRLVDCLADLAGVEPIALERLPTARGVARHDVFVAAKVGRAVDGDAIVVPQHDQPAELEMPGEPHRLVVDALHQAAVAGDDERAMIDQIVAVDRIEVAFGNGHADRHRQPLTKRPGGRLDSRQLEILRMPGTRAVQLPKLADVVHCRACITGEMKRGVDQHRPVPRRQDKAVAVRPVRVGRIIFEVPRK